MRCRFALQNRSLEQDVRLIHHDAKTVLTNHHHYTDSVRGLLPAAYYDQVTVITRTAYDCSTVFDTYSILLPVTR